MTDYEKKLEELKNTEFDTYTSINNTLIIQWFMNDYEFIEYVYSKDGEFIENSYKICYPKP